MHEQGTDNIQLNICVKSDSNWTEEIEKEKNRGQWIIPWVFLMVRDRIDFWTGKTYRKRKISNEVDKKRSESEWIGSVGTI